MLLPSPNHTMFGEVRGEEVGVQCGGHEHHAQVAATGEQVAEHNEQEVAEEVALVNLVDHQVRHVVQCIVIQQHAQHDACGAEQDAAAWPGWNAFQSYAIPNGLPCGSSMVVVGGSGTGGGPAWLQALIPSESDAKRVDAKHT